MDHKTGAQERMLYNRLQKRFRHLKKWAQRNGIEAFRLYDRDIPEIPLVLDFYGDSAFPAEAALCGALYKRPYEKEESDEIKWLSVMKDSAASALGIKPEHVFLKQRQKQKGFSQYEKIENGRFEKIIHENSLAFKINLSDYLDTGLFADRRLLRAMVRSVSSGKKVLNLFSYTGSFSVYAAAGGAVSTDSVDLSNTYLSRARENFSLNGFSAIIAKEMRNERNDEKKTHKLIRYDALEFINKAVKEKMKWDIIIVDPPAFSNSKKMTDDFDLNRDLTHLLGNCLKLLALGGKIFVSVNLKRSALTAEKLEAELKVRVTDLSAKTEDEDFKGRKMPKTFLIN